MVPDEQQDTGDGQEPLEYDRPPVETGCQQKGRVGRQKRAPQQGGAPALEPVEQPVEEPDCHGAQQQHR